MTKALRIWLFLVGIACVACEHVEVKPVEPEAPMRARDFYPLRVGSRGPTKSASVARRCCATSRCSQQDGFFVDSGNGHFAEDAKGLRDGDRYLIENPVAGAHLVQRADDSIVGALRITSAGHPCTVQAGTFGRSSPSAPPPARCGPHHLD